MANFYSDTQTRPTPAMRQAVLTAEVGDEQRFEDPSTLALEARVAELLGKEAAVLLPTGTMCNEIAIRVHTVPGDEIICERSSHIIGFEGGGPAALSGVMVHPIDGERGTFTAAQVERALRPESRYMPRSRMVSIEQTANMAGGTVWPLELIDEVADAGRAAGLAVHMDGARLLNAAVASGHAASDHTRSVDTVWIDLTKGLGAPVGAVLAGSQDFIASAWRFKQQWGGAMRQSGVLAAMGLHALDHHVDRLADDHERAARIGRALADLPGVDEVVEPQSNIVIFSLPADGLSPEELVAKAREAGVRLGAAGGRRCRIVTHLDVDDDDVDRLLDVLSDLLGR